MKILIVDDDLVSRSKMEVLLSTYGRCILARDGTEAIDAFKNAWDTDLPFNLITLDIDMPVMDGEEVLAQIREYEAKAGAPPEKQALVFMVSGLSEKEKVLKCLAFGCQDYIVKPFNIKVIEEKLRKFNIIVNTTEERAREPEASCDSSITLFEEITAKLKAGEVNFPSFPSIPLKFRRLMIQNAPSSAIAELLKQDVAISSKLIRMSNSAFYRGRQPNHTIEAAIARLGLSITEQLVNVLCSRSMFKIRKQQYRGLFEMLWTHSLACANAAEIIDARQKVGYKTEAFNMGLFHDIGRFCLLQIINDLSDQDPYKHKIDAQSVEDTLNLHHTKFGAAILKKWGFPKTYIDIAEFHHDPPADGCDFSALRMVHAANYFAKSVGYDCVCNKDPETEKSFESALCMQMDHAAIRQIQDDVRMKMQTMTEELA